MPDYEIELSDGRRFGVTADAPPSEADVMAALGQDSAAPTPQPKTPSAPMGGMLPTAGGLVGSLVGTAGGALLTPFMGPAGIVAGRTLGAGLGGALGKGAEVFLDEKSDTPSEAFQQMAGSGLEQGGAELAFGALGKVARAAAPRLMQSVLKPSKAIRQEFGNVADTMVERGIPLSRGGERKVGKLVASSAQKTREKLTAAQQLGAQPIPMAAVAPSLQRTAQKVSKEPLDAGAKLQELTDIGGRLLQQHPNPIPLLEAQEMKQAAQRVAGEGYRKIARGADINTVPLDANMDIARGLRQQIEQRVPSVGPLNAETQRLMGVERALDEAFGRIQNTQPIGMNALIASGAGLATAGGTGDPSIGGGVGLGILALTNPYLASRLAIHAPGVIANAPNAARTAALLSELANQQGQ